MRGMMRLTSESMDLQLRPILKFLERAGRENRVVVSADTDFGTILALRERKEPSVLIFRHFSNRPEIQLKALISNLSTIAGDLDSGSVVVIEEFRIRIRRLPICPSEEPE